MTVIPELSALYKLVYRRIRLSGARVRAMDKGRARQ